VWRDGIKQQLKKRLSRASSPEPISNATNNTQPNVVLAASSQTLTGSTKNGSASQNQLQRSSSSGPSTSKVVGNNVNIQSSPSGPSQNSISTRPTPTPSILIAASHSTKSTNNPLIATSPTKSQHTLWDKAVLSLSVEDQQLFLVPGHEKLDILKDVESLTNIKMKSCEDRQMKFRWNDKVIIIRDLANKVLVWVAKFKEIGDTLMQIDTG